MQLSKHIAQGKLCYLNQESAAISVSENEHFRWLPFANTEGESIIQSVMHRRKPWLLTLPHQTALLLPLLFFRPKNIVELGLGGGNLDRFIARLSPEISMQSIEYSQCVIHCFQRFFNPHNADVCIQQNNSTDWLSQEYVEQLDWLICDVYQAHTLSAQQSNEQLAALVARIDSNSCLSINLPDASDEEVNLCLTILQQLLSEHSIYYFHIPNYLNIVIQIIPSHWQTAKLLTRAKHSYLPKRLFVKWRKFWGYANEVDVQLK